MDNWLTFSLLDMTPYDFRSWVGLVSYYYQSVGVLPWAGIVLTVVFAGLVCRWSYARLQLGLLVLGGAWLWCGVVFHLQYYSALNWAATIWGWLFILQGGLLLLAALRLPEGLARPSSRVFYLGWALIFLGLLVHPLSGLLEGRDWQQLEWFAVMPAPTTFVTLGFLLLIPWRWRFGLLLIPLSGCLVSALFAWALGLLEFYWACLGLGVCLCYLLIRSIEMWQVGD